MPRSYPAEMLNVRIVSLVLIALMTLTTFITQKQLLVKGIANADSNPFLQQQKLWSTSSRSCSRLRDQLPHRRA